MASTPDPGGCSRFAKLGMAINEELTQACRDVLEMEVPPGLVYSKVKASSIYKKIRPEQELRLIGAKTDGYKEFDITLLYTLIRNICTTIPRPTKGWGGNSMPSVGETTIGDDVERIRLIRNNMFEHISSASTSQSEFDDTWQIITNVCQRLQTYTKKDYMSGLSNIQSQALEEENEKAIIENLEASYKSITDLMEKMSSLESHLLGIPVVDEILNAWREENKTFVPTKASRIVEEMFKSHNLVIVVGNSGSGKSAIIQHIALKHKYQGSNVIPVDEVREIKEKFSYSTKNDTLFVLNDPLGKESLDEILYTLWKNYQNTIETCLKKAKLLLPCRRCVLYDKRVKGILFEESTIVEIDTETNRLTDEEKRSILNQYTQNRDLSDEIVSEIIKTEAYFPLLCKLFSRPVYKENGLDFFKSPKRFIKQEIDIFKRVDKKKLCALILVVAFNNNLKIDTIVRNDDSQEKYKDILEMCELPENTHISIFRSTLQELKGSYVKRVGNSFQFLHDFIMEITTLDCPQETIQYAESGFLRRRVKIEDDREEEDRDPFTVYLPEEYIDDLVDRFIIDMQTEHIVDVLLNPCLRNKCVIRDFEDKIELLENLSNILSGINGVLRDISEFGKPFSDFSISRLTFLDWRVFHNYEIIPELIRLGADVNMLSAGDVWTPLILAAGNDDEHLREAGKKTKERERRNKTISFLLNYGAKINLCGDDGKPPLWITCQKGYTSTVQV
ncbi:uncharacterized protein LOC134258501 [Saccostrea cucullata]|uniref:uncharacterized protein LOC134258501 n=1 Tax=Saccostrea cuccullata TaxID=36930 RepID=UPI002ED39D2A